MGVRAGRLFSAVLTMKTKPKGIHANFVTSCHACRGDLTISNGRVDPHTCRIETVERPVSLADIRAALENRT